MSREKDIKNVVNLSEFAKRFEDLRCEGRYSQSYQEVSKGIEKKTGVYISHTQLSKYTKMGVQDEVTRGISAKNAIAIAEYFDLSVEYLLGLSNTRSYEDKYKVGSKAFCLAEGSMQLLEAIANGQNILHPEEYDYDMASYFNYVLTDVGTRLLSGVFSFLKILDEIENLPKSSEPPGVHSSPPSQELLDLNEKALAKRYAINVEFEKLLLGFRGAVKKKQ